MTHFRSPRPGRHRAVAASIAALAVLVAFGLPPSFSTPLVADVHPAVRQAWEAHVRGREDTRAADPATPLSGPVRHLRTTDSDDVLALEIAVTDLLPRAGAKAGPVVSLVGVAHIGDAGYYREIQAVLDKADFVLYESVMPPGAAGPIDVATDAERAERTTVSLQFVASLVERARDEEGRLPVDLEGVGRRASKLDGRMAEWIGQAAIDGWGRPFEYHVSPDGRQFRLVSLGADGRRGGEGVDADIAVDGDSLATAADDQASSIQAELAATLGLAFQLDAIDYERATFRCSDMDLDQLARALRARGLAMGDLGAVVDEQSLSGRLATVMLRLMRSFDALLGGAMSDTMKVLLVELLGDATLVERSLDQLAPGLGAVLIVERNEVVLDDLAKILPRFGPGETIVIFYGAGHMPHFVDELDERFGYVPVEQRWLRAMSVDLTASSVDRRQLASIRLAVRSAMRQMIQR